MLGIDRKGHSMTEFKNVTVVKKANVYFDGKVTSRTVLFPDGSKKTLGIMLPGEFEFNTADKEIMEIMAGDLEVLLPGEAGWKSIRGGEAFEVPAQSKFSLKVKSLTDYCCSFIP
jgi:purine/pyrimidine-nucleoside phosphorylase